MCTKVNLSVTTPWPNLDHQKKGFNEKFFAEILVGWIGLNCLKRTIKQMELSLAWNLGTSLLHIIQVSIQVLFSLDQVHVEVSTSKLTARISQMVAFDRVDGWFADTSIIQQLCLAPSSVWCGLMRCGEHRASVCFCLVKPFSKASCVSSCFQFRTSICQSWHTALCTSEKQGLKPS